MPFGSTASWKGGNCAGRSGAGAGGRVGTGAWAASGPAASRVNASTALMAVLPEPRGEAPGARSPA